MVIDWTTDSQSSPARVAICLPEPDGSRLAEVIRHQLGVSAAVLPAFREGAAAYYLVLPDQAPRAVATVGAARVAILYPHGAGPQETARFAGAAILEGPLPGAVLTWLRAVAGSPVSAPSLWGDATAGVGTGSPAPQSLAVFSTGGGVGKTTTAVHLAVAAAGNRLATGLIELDEDRRGILTYFDRRPRAGLDSLSPSDWAEPPRLAAALETVGVTVQPSLTVVPMVGTLAGLQYKHGDTTYLPHVFDWAAARFALTVYDLPAKPRDEVVLAALMRADRIVFVADPVLSTVESAVGYLKLLESIPGAGPALLARMGLLCNKVTRTKKADIPPADMAQALGLPLLGTVPLDIDRYYAAVNHHRVHADAAWHTLLRAALASSPDGASDAERGAVKAPGVFRRWWRRR